MAAFASGSESKSSFGYFASTIMPEASFIGYEAVKIGDPATAVIADVEKPTQAELSALSDKLASLTATTLTAGTPATTYTADLPVGDYMIMVTAASGKELTSTYIPMVASVQYTVNGVAAGTVDAADNWNVEGQTAVAKSTKPTVEKTVVGNGDNNVATDANGQGDHHDFNETVDFKVTSAIPAFNYEEYSKETSKCVYKITDTLDAGLDYLAGDDDTEKADNLVVKVNGTAVEASDATYSVSRTKGAGGGFVITFAKAYILAHANAPVEVTYTCKLNEHADTNFNPNDNTVTVNYSNSPTDEQGGNTETDVTHHYTFEIDGDVSGETAEGAFKTHELIKVQEGEPDQRITWREELGETTVPKALEAAEFALYKKTSDDTTTPTADALRQRTAVATATTTSNGYMNFKGLDAETYYLVETKAPAPYTLSDTVTEVVITATMNEDGTLNTYTITIGGVKTSSYQCNYGNDGQKTYVDLTDDVDTDQTTFIINTTEAELPSTGGIGTYVFTVAGVAIMVVAAGLLVVRHKKKAE